MYIEIKKTDQQQVEENRIYPHGVDIKFRISEILRADGEAFPPVCAALKRKEEATG